MSRTWPSRPGWSGWSPRAAGPSSRSTLKGLPARRPSRPVRASRIRADRIPPYDERMDRPGLGDGSRRCGSSSTRLSRLERVLAVAAGVVFVGLVVAEPSIVRGPVREHARVGAVVGGAVLTATALLVMLHFRVRPVIRVVASGSPWASRRGC